MTLSIQLADHMFYLGGPEETEGQGLSWPCPNIPWLGSFGSWGYGTGMGDCCFACVGSRNPWSVLRYIHVSRLVQAPLLLPWYMCWSIGGDAGVFWGWKAIGAVLLVFRTLSWRNQNETHL